MYLPENFFTAMKENSLEAVEEKLVKKNPRH